MSNGIPCKVCGWTQTAHDMAVRYRKRRWYIQCRHRYVPERNDRKFITPGDDNNERNT